MNMRIAILAVGLLLAAPAAAQDIHQAATRGDTAAVRTMLEANPELLEARNPWGRTPLCAAARDGGGNAAVIRLLIELGADVNAADKSGWIPIGLAAWRGAQYRETVDALLDAGAALPSGGREAGMLLEYAAAGGLERLYDAMIEKGAAPDTASAFLHAAAGGGSKRIVESLVARGFDANKKDEFGWTPLHIAAEQGQREIMALLLERGAGIDARNMLGQTAYNVLQERDDGELAAFLRAAGADTAPPAFPEVRGKYLGRPRPGLTAQKFAPGIVSHRYRPHSTVAISPKGDEIFWNPMIEPRGGGYSYGYLMTTRLENGRWTYPRKAAFSEKDFKDDHPFFSYDGKKLYFASSRPIDGAPVPAGEKRVWCVEKTKRGWSEPRYCAELPVPAGPRVLFFTFSFDRKGNYYYATDGNIWRSRFAGGKYAPAEKLPAPVNTDAMEGSPLISPEGDYLIFVNASVREPRVSFRGKDGSWSEPLNIAEQVGRGAMNFTRSGDYLMIGGHGWVEAKAVEQLRPK